MVKTRNAAEIIELSSSDEDFRYVHLWMLYSDLNEFTSYKHVHEPITPYKQQYTPAPTKIQKTPSTPVRKAPIAAVRRNKFIINSSEDEDTQKSPHGLTPVTPKNDKTLQPFRADIMFGDDGVIQ